MFFPKLNSRNLTLATSLFLLCLTGIHAQDLTPTQLLGEAQLLAKDGRYAEAEVPLSKAAQLAPADPAVLTALAKIKGLTRQYEAAQSLFRKVIELTPNSPESHVDYAISLMDGGQPKPALAQTEIALHLAPKDVAAHLNRARILADLHRSSEARAEFEKTVALAPRNPDALFYWALLEREDQNLVREADLLKRLTVLQPRNAKAFFMLGQSLSEQGRKPEAVAALRESLAINPDSGETLYLLARNLQQQHPAEARQLLQRFQATRQETALLDQVKTFGNEAYQSYNQGDYAKATSLLRRALELCGECQAAAGLHKNLGLTLCKNGDVPAGKEELRQALALDPNDRDVVRALQLLGN
jgi:tetratricopeptide (TPR) repeat protein